MERKNSRVVGRILEGVRMLNYPEGTPMIAEVLYKDIHNLEKEGKLDFSDVITYDGDNSLKDTMIANCNFALLEMEKLEHVRKESIDLTAFPTVTKRHKVQFRFSHDSCTAYDKITMNAIKLQSMLH